MPAPEPYLMASLIKRCFLSEKNNIPYAWEPETEDLQDSVNNSVKQTSPNSPHTLFQHSTLNVYHVTAAREVGSQVEHFIDGIAKALCEAVGIWMKLAMVHCLEINGAVGQLKPGGVTGPDLLPLIMASAPRETATHQKYSDAIAYAVGEKWQAWQSGLNGILMYPSLSSCPGSVAPPTPNQPVPLAMLSSSGEQGLSPKALTHAMNTHFGNYGAYHAGGLFSAVAKGFHACFLQFKATTVLQKVMGTGPVPVAAGPVQKGSVVPAPGILM